MLLATYNRVLCFLPPFTNFAIIGNLQPGTPAMEKKLKANKERKQKVRDVAFVPCLVFV